MIICGGKSSSHLTWHGWMELLTHLLMAHLLVAHLLVAHLLVAHLLVAHLLVTHLSLTNSLLAHLRLSHGLLRVKHLRSTCWPNCRWLLPLLSSRSHHRLPDSCRKSDQVWNERVDELREIDGNTLYTLLWASSHRVALLIVLLLIVLRDKCSLLLVHVTLRHVTWHCRRSRRVRVLLMEHIRPELRGRRGGQRLGLRSGHCRRFVSCSFLGSGSFQLGLRLEFGGPLLVAENSLLW